MSDRDFERGIERLRAALWYDEVADVEPAVWNSIREWRDAKTGRLMKSSYCRGPGEQALHDPWGPAGRYGGKLVNWMVQSRAGVSVDDLGEAVPEEKFNNEGEKQMEKIDWHKPLRALNSHGEPQGGEARTYKSGKQRVVWVDDRVYPVDDQGRATAEVWYSGDRHSWPRVGALKGSKLVENAPEEKFFVGLYRFGNGAYWLPDGGVPTTMSVLAPWSQLMKGAPHWIVDTRKSAEPPKAIEHDPEDWAVVYVNSVGGTTTFDMMTKDQAEAARLGPQCHVVRIRTTPPPADTARYVQLYRRHGQNDAWRINALDGRQELAGSELSGGRGYYEYVHVKVRD